MKFSERIVRHWYAPRLTALTAALFPLSLVYRGVVSLRRALFNQAVLSRARMRAVWAEDLDISDAATLKTLAIAAGQDASALAQRAALDATGDRYEALTQEAIQRQVFGAPTYVYRGEAFWGQDRLDFLDRSLAK